ncbi:MAG: hypothetical protein L0Y71_17880 [Gemmataceae bacterium]|nr:hypothetical protein [Gemmataceae bacterium]
MSSLPSPEASARSAEARSADAPSADTRSADTLSGEQALRLLEAMRPVCSHDLPNQAVALQSLLQLFAWDESAQWSPQGREYFDRLQSIAGKTMALSQYLKELARLARYEPRHERLTFADIVEDVRVEIQQGDPDCRRSWHCAWRADEFRGDRRLVQQGLRQLMQLARCSLSGNLAIRMESSDCADRLEWAIVAIPDPAAAPAERGGVVERGAGERRGADGCEPRLALALAQEYLAATGIDCRTGLAPAPGGLAFTLVIPKRP